MVGASEFICCVYIETLPIDAHQVILTYGIYVVFKGHICCCIKVTFLVIFTGIFTIVGSLCRLHLQVQWDILVQCGRPTCKGAYGSNVKCMYTSVPGHIINCNGLI